MHHAVVVVIMPHCLAATGVDTFCPGTVWATCVWRLFAVTVLACLRAFQRVFVHAYAYSNTHNHMTMCAYTGPRDTRRTTAGQPMGQPAGPPRDNPRGSPWDNRGTTHGTATGQPTWPLRDRVWGPATVWLKSRGRRRAPPTSLATPPHTALFANAPMGGSRAGASNLTQRDIDRVHSHSLSWNNQPPPTRLGARSRSDLRSSLPSSTTVDACERPRPLDRSRGDLP